MSNVKAREKAIHHAIERFRNKPIQTIEKHNYQRSASDTSMQYNKNYAGSIVASADVIFKYAYDMKLIRMLPSEGTKRPKKEVSVEELEDTEVHKKFFGKDELFQFLEAVKSHHSPQNSSEVFCTLAYTGIRAGELLALKWSDMDLENSTINITKTYYSPDNDKKQHQIPTPKTEDSIEEIPVNPHVIKLLKDYRMDIQDTWKSELYVDNNLVFTDVNGYPLVIKKLQLWIKAILKKINITNRQISAHLFRHTHCSLLIEAGVHVKEMQERL